MASWKRHLVDYEIAIWDRESFDVESVPYVREACAARRWAFAADYIRLWALYHYGGIYLDSDVFVHRSLDPFLEHRCFSSKEFHTRMFYDSLKRETDLNDTEGLGIEAAVEFETGRRPWIDSLRRTRLGDSVITRYTFEDNFYFAAGNNTMASMDSRYWGFVPEVFVLGVVTRVAYSYDPEGGGVRWGRLWRDVSYRSEN